MSTPAKEPLGFHFHLTTALAVLLVAGALLGANILMGDAEYVSHGRLGTFTARCYGLPIPFIRSGIMHEEPYTTFSKLLLTIDIILWTAILWFVYFICEWVIRRKRRSGP